MILQQQSLKPLSKIHSRVELQDLTLHSRSCLKLLVTWLPLFLLEPPQNIPKLSKSREHLNSYPPISFPCVPCKIFGKLIHARVKPINDQLLPSEQARFRSGRLTADQTVLLTQNYRELF